MEEKRVLLKIKGLTNSQLQSEAFALILSDSGLRRLPVIIGAYEAQSIAIAIEGITPPRPLTHDLLILMIKTAGFKLEEVYIHKFEEGIFYSEIIMVDNYREIRLDARTSDAIALALRANCQIYTTETVMKKCSIVIDEDSESAENDPDQFPEEITVEHLKDVSKFKKQLRKMQKKEIEERMTKAIAEENYELAKIYNDELIHRDKNKT